MLSPYRLGRTGKARGGEARASSQARVERAGAAARLQRSAALQAAARVHTPAVRGDVVDVRAVREDVPNVVRHARNKAVANSAEHWAACEGGARRDADGALRVIGAERDRRARGAVAHAVRRVHGRTHARAHRCELGRQIGMRRSSRLPTRAAR